jgi:SSS family solute:Na+ symporter
MSALLLTPLCVSSSFTTLDWLVIFVYGIGMLFAGWWYSRVGSVEDYHLGGRAMNPLAVGISLFATLMSTLTYLAYPGEMIAHGPMVLGAVLSYPIVYLVVGRFIIPFIMKLKVISAYEILERRFGLSVRLAGSSIFLSLRLLWMAMIVFATADVVLVPLMGLDPSVTPWVCVVMALVTIVYTSMGGLQAVVFIDVLQTIIMLAGALISLAIITYAVGGVGAWWPDTWLPHWDKPSLWFAPESRMSLGMMVLSSFVWYVCTAGSDQMAIQRYLATRDARAARQMFGYSLWCNFFVSVLLAALGLGLLAYFSQHPQLLPEGASIYKNADQLLPQFIVRVMPAGIGGLVIAGILSAAMDSLSSGLNSAASVITEDWVDRIWKRKLTATEGVRQAKLVSWLVGIAVIVLSLLAGLLTGNLLELCYRFVNLLTSPLFVLFFMAMFVPWATTFGAWAALLTSLSAAVGIAYFNWLGLSFLWIGPASLAIGIIAGSAASLLPIGQRRPMLEKGE